MSLMSRPIPLPRFFPFSFVSFIVVGPCKSMTFFSYDISSIPPCTYSTPKSRKITPKSSRDLIYDTTPCFRQSTSTEHWPANDWFQHFYRKAWWSKKQESAYPCPSIFKVESLRGTLSIFYFFDCYFCDFISSARLRWLRNARRGRGRGSSSSCVDFILISNLKRENSKRAIPFTFSSYYRSRARGIVDYITLHHLRDWESASIKAFL